MASHISLSHRSRAPKYYCCIFSQDYNLGQGVPVDETPYSHQGSSGQIVQDWDVEEHLGIYNRIVFRIKDNSATTLFFDAPISKYFQSTSTMPMSEMPDGFSQMGRQISGIAIYSDRQMASLDRVSWSLGEMHAGPAGIFPGWSLPRSVPEYVGCRYAKLTLFGCYRADKDEQETRIGRMMTGFMANLSCPDFEWGVVSWSYKWKHNNHLC